jgi:predicted dehydrogenase
MFLAIILFHEHGRVKKMKIGMVGYKFMGRAHSHAYRTAPHFFDIKGPVELAAVCGRDEQAVAAFAQKHGWQSYETDWRVLVERDDIDAVDIGTPNSSHYEIAIAAAQAGKHILLEKPMALNGREAQEMLAAAQKAGIKHQIGFNYRRVPAVALAKAIMNNGDLGHIIHWRAVYNQDWLVDPQVGLLWRLDKNVAGTGAIGDLASHIVDLAYHLVGPIAEVTGLTKTFIEKRPYLDDPARKGRVTVDDCFAFLARFENGATGTFEGSRLATGRLNYNAFEINGSKGSIAFNLERMNELQLFIKDDPAPHRGWRTINVTDSEHPYVSAWWPPGHILGWEESHIHQVADFIMAIEQDRPCDPDFSAGVANQAVLDALARSAVGGLWEKVVI